MSFARADDMGWEREEGLESMWFIAAQEVRAIQRHILLRRFTLLPDHRLSLDSLAQVTYLRLYSLLTLVAMLPSVPSCRSRFKLLLRTSSAALSRTTGPGMWERLNPNVGPPCSRGSGPCIQAHSYAL